MSAAFRCSPCPRLRGVFLRCPRKRQLNMGQGKSRSPTRGSAFLLGQPGISAPLLPSARSRGPEGLLLVGSPRRPCAEPAVCLRPPPGPCHAVCGCRTPSQSPQSGDLPAFLRRALGVGPNVFKGGRRVTAFFFFFSGLEDTFVHF